jgi:hypothetical protein
MSRGYARRTGQRQRRRFGFTACAAAERIDDAVDLSRRLQAEARDVCERSRALRAYLLAARSTFDGSLVESLPLVELRLTSASACITRSCEML